MKLSNDHIERLISRCLDDECSAAQRRELNAELRRNPDAQALYEEHSDLDREVRRALREELGDSRSVPLRMPLWQRTARVVALAAAACLALLVWLSPPGGERLSIQEAPTRAGLSSWFSPPPAAGDVLIDTPDYSARRRVESPAPQTRLILVPTETPGEYLVIEVNQTPVRAVRIQEDF